LLASYKYFGFRKPEINGKMDHQKGSFIGPSYSSGEIEAFLNRKQLLYTKYDSAKERNKALAEELNNGKVLGYFDGRMEFGPRALGSRSILGDARDATMQSRMNLKIKFRESFRPFAPSVLIDDVDKYFELKQPSQYMLLVAQVKANRRIPSANCDMSVDMITVINQRRSDIPAVTHIDFSARIQTVHQETNPNFYGLIEEFKNLTGSSCIVNTSFNIRGEPIVCSLFDAYCCFIRTDIDILVLGNYVLYKDQQSLASDDEIRKTEFEPD
jgi:carbamoyltransferase